MSNSRLEIRERDAMLQYPISFIEQRLFLNVLWLDWHNVNLLGTLLLLLIIFCFSEILPAFSISATSSVGCNEVILDIL